jgi:hypothetical protein
VDEETVVITQAWDLFHFDAHSVSKGKLGLKYLRSIHPSTEKVTNVPQGTPSTKRMVYAVRLPVNAIETPHEQGSARNH